MSVAARPYYCRNDRPRGDGDDRECGIEHAIWEKTEAESEWHLDQHEKQGDAP